MPQNRALQPRAGSDVAPEDQTALVVLAKGVLLSILLTRASIDKVLGAIPFAFFGVPFGALINVIVIVGAAFLCVMTYPRCRGGVGVWMPLLILYMAISLIYTPDQGDAARFVAAVATNLAILALPFALVRTESQIRSYFLLVLLSAVMPVLLGPILGGERAESTFPHPNIYGFYIVLILLTGGLSMSWESWRDFTVYRRIFLVLLLPALYMLYRTGARGAWGSLLGAGFFLAIFLDRRFMWLMLAAPLALLVPDVQERLADVFAPVEYVGNGVAANSYAWRVLLWESAYSWFLESPFIGYGADSFSSYSTRFFALEDVGYNAHSVYVQIGFELGVIGLFVWFMIFVRLGITGWRARSVAPEASSLLMALVVFYMLICYSDNILYYLSFNWYYWFVVGLCFRWILLRQQEVDARGQT